MFNEEAEKRDSIQTVARFDDKRRLMRVSKYIPDEYHQMEAKHDTIEMGVNLRSHECCPSSIVNKAWSFILPIGLDSEKSRA